MDHVLDHVLDHMILDLVITMLYVPYRFQCQIYVTSFDVGLDVVP